MIIVLLITLLCPISMLSLGGRENDSPKVLYDDDDNDDDDDDDDDESFGNQLDRHHRLLIHLRSCAPSQTDDDDDDAAAGAAAGGAADADDEIVEDQLDGHQHKSLIVRSCDPSQADRMSSVLFHVEDGVTIGSLCEAPVVHCSSPKDENKTWSEQSGCRDSLQLDNNIHGTILCKMSTLMDTKSTTYIIVNNPEPDITNTTLYIGTFIINAVKKDVPDLQNETVIHVTLKPFLIGLNHSVRELACNVTQLECSTRQNHDDMDIGTFTGSPQNITKELHLICNTTSNSCYIFCHPNVDITHRCVSYDSIQLINNDTQKPSLYMGCEPVRTKSRESPSGRHITNILNGPVLVTIQTTGLVFLFLTFLTHCLFSELRTAPGINLMFLVSSLFVTHLVFLSGGTAVRTQAVCRAVGMLLHFSWLSSFAWMSVCSFHMYKVFRTIAPMSRCGIAADFNRMCGYCLFAFGVPFLIVAATCIVNLVLSKGAKIGYGRKYNVVCFVSFNDGGLITFVFPILFNMFYTLFFLVRSCITFQKASKVRKYCGQRNMNMLSHSLRLSTLVGVSWLAGGLAVIIKREIIVFIFILLSSSHGVFLFVAFVCTKRVLGLYIHIFQRCNRRVTEPMDIAMECIRKY